MHKLAYRLWILFLSLGLAITQHNAVADEKNPLEEQSMKIEAKRLPPPEVSSVSIGDVRYEVIHWGKERGLEQNGGYIAAFDKQSNQELWVLKVYDVTYDKNLEEDVQDVFIKSMTKAWLSEKLKIEDENGRCYVVDPETRTVEVD